MNTQTIPSSARLRTVEELLERLSSMRTDGHGARERLEFLRNHGGDVVQAFSIEDAFDADAKAGSARVAELEELSSRARAFKTAWQGAPLSEDVQQAGGTLLKLLIGFISDAQKSERTSEIDMLGQLWEHGPDISHVYPENVRLEVRAPFDLPGNQELQAAKDRLQAEITQQNLQEVVIPDDEPRVQELTKTGAETEAPVPGALDEDAAAAFKGDLERKIREFDNGTHLRRDFPVMEAPASAAEVVPSPRLEKDVKDPQDDSRLRQEAWTDAIREVTLAPWRFHLEASGHIAGRGAGTTMVWKLENNDTAYIKLETARGWGFEYFVRLEWTNPKLRIRKLEREFTEPGLADLHLNPAAFVAELLNEE